MAISSAGQIQEALTSYFIGALIADERDRAIRPQSPPRHHPKFKKWDMEENPDSPLLEYHQDISEELSEYGRNYIGIADRFLVEYDLTIQPNTELFWQFYRELLKVMLSVLSVQYKRSSGDYNDELYYLLGRDRGIDFESLVNNDAKPKEIYSQFVSFMDYQRDRREDIEKAKWARADAKSHRYDEFDIQVKQALSDSTKKISSKALATRFKGYVRVDHERAPLKLDTLRKRVDEIKCQYSSKKHQK